MTNNPVLISTLACRNTAIGYKYDFFSKTEISEFLKNYAIVVMVWQGRFEILGIT